MRYLESRKPESLLPDERYAQIVHRLDHDFSVYGRVPDISSSMIAARTIIMDNIVLGYLGNRPGGTVVSLGSGLDFRFMRITNGTVVWYDVDMPEVIALRRKLFRQTEGEHYVPLD